MSFASRVRTFALLAAPCGIAAALPTPVTAQTVAIRAGQVVDPETGGSAADQTILIEAGRIKAIGKGLPIPADAKVIDLSRHVVLPGFVDAHTHLCATVDAKWDLGNFWIMALQRRTGFRAIQGAAHAREMLDAGFTAVRDLGNAGDYVDMDLEKAIRFGIVVGPTIVPAGRIIGPFGGQFWDAPADRRLLDNPEYAFADSRDELRRAVRENVYFGAKVIKLVVDGQKYAYSADDVRFVVDEAAGAGLKVAAHAQTERGARRAIEAGVASVEHGWVLSNEDLALAKEKRVVLVSTDFTEKVLLANGMTEEAAKRTHAKYVERLGRASRAGVAIVFGTDIMVDVKGATRGSLALEYVDSFLEAGVPPLEILRAMTTRAAALLGVETERGPLKQGLAADLVAVPRNPLEDARALKEVVFVMRDGNVIRDATR